MFSLYQPLPVMSVINCSILLAKQQALGFSQPCCRAKCGSLLTSLLHLQVGSAIIYWQSCCWQEWRLFGSSPMRDLILKLLFLSFSPASAALYRFTQGSGSFSAFGMLRGTQTSCKFHKSPPSNAKHFWSFLISTSCISATMQWKLCIFSRSHLCCQRLPGSSTFWTFGCLNQVREEQHKFRVKEVQPWTV